MLGAMKTFMFDIVLVKARMRILFVLYEVIIYNCNDYMYVLNGLVWLYAS